MGNFINCKKKSSDGDKSLNQELKLFWERTWEEILIDVDDYKLLNKSNDIPNSSDMKNYSTILKWILSRNDLCTCGVQILILMEQIVNSMRVFLFQYYSKKGSNTPNEEGKMYNESKDKSMGDKMIMRNETKSLMSVNILPYELIEIISNYIWCKDFARCIFLAERAKGGTKTYYNFTSVINTNNYKKIYIYICESLGVRIDKDGDKIDFKSLTFETDVKLPENKTDVELSENKMSVSTSNTDVKLPISNADRDTSPSSIDADKNTSPSNNKTNMDEDIMDCLHTMNSKSRMEIGVQPGINYVKINIVSPIKSIYSHIFFAAEYKKNTYSTNDSSRFNCILKNYNVLEKLKVSFLDIESTHHNYFTCRHADKAVGEDVFEDEIRKLDNMIGKNGKISLVDRSTGHCFIDHGHIYHDGNELAYIHPNDYEYKWVRTNYPEYLNDYKDYSGKHSTVVDIMMRRERAKTVLKLANIAYNMLQEYKLNKKCAIKCLELVNDECRYK